MQRLIRVLVVFLIGALVAAPGVSSTALASGWPLVKEGDSGANVVAVQYLLQAHSYSLSADGQFGPQTRDAVKRFQARHHLSADGIVGPATWPRLIVTVRRGSTGSAVKAVQYVLAHTYGASIAVDGAFGPTTEGAVISFQRSHGLGVDGIVGPQTWQALVSGSGTGGGGSGGDRASLARRILSLNSSGRVALNKYSLCCGSDGADPYSNIRDTANGGAAKRSYHPRPDSAGDCGPGGSVYLDPRMLRGMLAVAQRFSYRVTAIAGGTHVCRNGQAVSLHFQGRAFDMDEIDGAGISRSNPHTDVMAICRSLGATEVLGPSNRADHPTHIHCGWTG